MTKEELKEMAKEYEKSVSADYLQDDEVIDDYAYKKDKVIQAYIDGFEDSVSTVNDILEDNEELKERVSELERNVYSLRTTGQDEYINALEEQYNDLKAQIEKMKCCGNCKHIIDISAKFKYCRIQPDKIFNNNICDKWELAE